MNERIGINRRDVVAAAAGAVAASTVLLKGCATECVPAAPSKPGPIESYQSLGALAAKRGVAFGSAFDMSAIWNESYGRLLKHHARLVTTDNSLKFGMIRGNGPEPWFANADRLVEFAAGAGIPVHGHTLAWNEHLPAWIKAESASRRAYWLERHITEMVGRYPGKVTSWDVVNEPIWPGHKLPGGFRGGPWYEALGTSYIEKSLRWAAAADPKALLSINEADCEWTGEDASVKRQAILRLVRTLKDAGAPLHIIGLESHWDKTVTFVPALFEEYVGQLGELGVDVYVTELDVNDGKLFSSTPTRDKFVGDIYSAIVTSALQCRPVKAIITWQLADSQSYLWQSPAPAFNPGWRPRPLPFDYKLNPKPAYDALVSAFGG